MIDSSFWRDRRVLVTGHTGFKGSWLSLWLHSMGARVVGYALPPPTEPSLFELAGVASGMTSIIGDVRDLESLAEAVRTHQPEIVIHMAAQPLVRLSYREPVETYATNVMGTVHLMEAVRRAGGVRAVLIVTSDKCYRNHEWVYGYREEDQLGGHDPYSNSKGCAELVCSAYRDSFFPVARLADHGTAVASARAGNVIGGGDWAEDRLVPDLLRGFLAGTAVGIRNPNAIRPWQHVLEPLSGYLRLAQGLHENRPELAGAWNFGPREDDARPVGWIADRLVELWGPGASWERDGDEHPHEAHYLRLDWSKARQLLDWSPRWLLDEALARTVNWFLRYREKPTRESIVEATLEDIRAYVRPRTAPESEGATRV
jgi:CDP-glucose 4,6-dehydratase